MYEIQSSLKMKKKKLTKTLYTQLARKMNARERERQKKNTESSVQRHTQQTQTTITAYKIQPQRDCVVKLKNSTSKGIEIETKQTLLTLDTSFMYSLVIVCYFFLRFLFLFPMFIYWNEDCVLWHKLDVHTNSTRASIVAAVASADL